MASRTKQYGINAVEVMITLAIVGVLATVAMPGLGAMVASQRLKAAASDLHSSLLQARSEAIKRNSSVTIAPAEAGWAGGWTVSVDDAPITVQGGYANLTIAGPDSLVYSGTGRLQGDNAPEFELSSASTDSVRCVTVDLSGRPANKHTAC